MELKISYNSKKVMDMKEYLEQVLHQEIQLKEFRDIKKLPLIYQKQYRYYLAHIINQEFLVAEPTEDIHLSSLRKQHRQLEMSTGMQCVLYLHKMNYYARDTLIRDGISFIWEGHQIYLPFLGMVLSGEKGRTLPTIPRISFLTQKLLLTALYDRWDNVSVTKAAELLAVTKTSITRCFDELESMSFPYLTVSFRSRKLSGDTDKKAMWNAMESIIRDPLIARYELEEVCREDYPLGGMSALAHYSMLGDNAYPTMAVTKNVITDVLKTYRRKVAGAETKCIIEEVGYQILWPSGRAIDPLTVSLLIPDKEKNDPRVAQAVEEMLEKYVW